VSDTLLTVPEVAERANVSERTVRRLIDRGELPETRIGVKVLVWESALSAFLESRTKRRSSRLPTVSAVRARRRTGTLTRKLRAVEGETG